MNASDDFEQQLARTPRRAAPPEWRAEILAAAHLPGKPTTTSSSPSTIGLLVWWQRLLIRFPVATGGLAAVWVFIFATASLTRWIDGAGAPAVNSVSREQIAQARAQRAELWQLAGLTEPGRVAKEQPTDQRPRDAAPRPRSDLRRDDDDHFGSLPAARARQWVA